MIKNLSLENERLEEENERLEEEKAILEDTIAEERSMVHDLLAPIADISPAYMKMSPDHIILGHRDHNVRGVKVLAAFTVADMKKIKVYFDVLKSLVVKNGNG